MVIAAPIITPVNPISYPSSDGEPVAETYDHFYAIAVLLEMLQQYLAGKQATVLGNQFLYYAQGLPRMRVAPDVMVIFDVPPGGRDNYKIWEEGQVPAAVFEITSKSTQITDTGFKRDLYAQMGVQEYWLFDPKNEWLDQQLQGYRLQGETYEPIEDGNSLVLGLRLSIENKKIALHRLDNGEKLPFPAELAEQVNQERQAKLEAEQARQEIEALLQRYRDRYGDLEA
ncbi:Uma2 family endonuclease [Pseudanabaena sp. FACHB-1277]|uniref:Uma2 family endonuclease n=1 Tax=Pseudanabaena cinerea FACHB-1277 TaxID=2949581 RepID=A0A926UUC4_9CYAN|nr:Uma2 family endonuclease [Pseudanabaena cinerea]MBD2151292.1 Uma2 family endonuclease [Pseudanabaena cinerea FACHB-1277]